MTIYGQRGVCPIGSVIAWIKSFTGVPALATQGRDEWIEANGGTITDVESPLNGQTIPDIMGTTDATKKFLRGATTSGGAGSVVNHIHCLVSVTVTVSNAICADGTVPSYGGWYAWTSNDNHIPPYYEVVYICRIK